MPVASAEGASALDIRSLLQRQHLGSDNAGGPRPRRYSDDERNDPDAPSEDRRQHYREGKERDHEEPVGEPHENDVGPTPEESGDDTDQRAEEHRDRSREKTYEQGDLRPLDDEVEHRPAELVGPERELRRRRLQRGAGSPRHREAILGGEDVCKQRQQHEEDEYHQARNPQGVFREDARGADECTLPALPPNLHLARRAVDSAPPGAVPASPAATRTVP